MSDSSARYMEQPKRTTKPNAKLAVSVEEQQIKRKYHTNDMLERLLIADLDGYHIMQLVEMAEELQNVVGVFVAEVEILKELRELNKCNTP